MIILGKKGPFCKLRVDTHQKETSVVLGPKALTFSWFIILVKVNDARCHKTLTKFARDTSARLWDL